ncbi:MAG: hypothetical protein ACOYXC_09145 [Candidatus Rifleibacteriota bacterium]
MKKIYRTILICKEFNDTFNLIYGHQIEWFLTEIDYQIKEWKGFEKFGFHIFFSDLTEISELDSLINNCQVNLLVNEKNYKIYFPHTEEENDFISLSYPKDQFNPLNHYSGTSIVYFGPELILNDTIQDFIAKNEIALDFFRDEFSLNFSSFPEVVGCFMRFFPTRLLTHFKGFEEDGGGFFFQIYDEFKCFQDSRVEIRTTCDDKENDYNFILKDNPSPFYCGYVPDLVQTKIFQSDSHLIFSSTFSVLKKINFSLNIGDTPIIIDGQKRDRYISIKSEV